MLGTDAISAEDVATFRAEGAVVLRNYVDEKMLTLLREAYTSLSIQDSDGELTDFGRRSLVVMDPSCESEALRCVIREARIAQTAAAAMGSCNVWLYEDILLVKEPGNLASPTPWHQDPPAWPFKGSQMCSIWISLDEARADTSAMQVVMGSHLKPIHTPSTATVPKKYHHLIIEEGGGPIPDVDELPDLYPTKFLETRVGDAVLFHPAVLHSAPGSPLTGLRRAFSFRMLGDDVRWFNRGVVLQDRVREIRLPNGAKIDEANFERLWPLSRL